MSRGKVTIALGVFVVAILAIWLSPLSQPKMISLPPLEPMPQIAVEPVATMETFVPVVEEIIEVGEEKSIRSTSCDQDLPADVDIIAQLFNPYPPILPIVETVSYVSRVPWLTSRPAYLGDWASYYETSKHFISRSLTKNADYFHEKVSRGDRFNVFRKDKTIEFHMVVDLSRAKLWLYYFDKDENQRELLKSYRVCVGKLSQEKRSGSLTPTGVFEIGREIAIYHEGDMGLYANELCEMVTIFGKRWIPFAREVADCSGPCKGLGFHGVPWVKNLETGALVEKRECVGEYNSLGCIRLLTEDIQEIFAIIISKPSYVHIVKDFQDARLPGKEKS